MENLTGLMSRWPYGPEIPFGTKSWGVVVNSDLAAGILLGTSLAGLLAYFCAFWVQRTSALSLFKRSFIMSFSCEHVNLRGVQNTHVSIFALIFVDVVNVIGAVTFGSHLAAGSCPKMTCVFTNNIWILSRRYLVMIHLLTALISLLYLSYPHLGAKLRCVFSLVALLICVLHYSFVVYTNIILESIEALYIQEALTCALGVAIIATSGLRGRKKDKLRIIVVAMITFLVVYFPTFVLDYLIYSRAISGLPTEDYNVIYTNVYYFTNLNIILDGLLCHSILKLSDAEGAGEDREQQPQQWELQPRGQQQPQKYQQQPQQQQQQQPRQQQQQQQPWQQQQQQQQPWQQQQQQQPWQQQQQQQQQPWQQQQPQSLAFPRVHVNDRAVDDYNRENWD